MRLSQVEVEVKVEGAILADNYSLSPAYPNPFNATLTLPFMLQERMNVEISLYDVSGRMVKQVVNQSISAGDYSLRVNSDELSSGLYIIKIIMNQSTHYQRVVLLK